MSDEDDNIDNDFELEPSRFCVDDDDDDSDEDNRPLVSMTNGQNGNVDNHYEDDSDDDSEDNVPLVSRVKRKAAVTRAAPPSSEGGDEEDSDDDVPLALTVRAPVPAAAPKRTARPRGVSKAPPVKRKKTSVKKEPKREPTTGRRQTPKLKREAVVRKPRAKKEEDVKFEMPGQKRETPPENDPARLFYQSMYYEKVRLGKKSDVATSWMLRHGLLEEKLAKKLAK